MSNLSKEIQQVQRAQQLLAIKEMKLLEKGMSSNNPSDVVAVFSKLQNAKKIGEDDGKAFLIDPLQFQTALGFKDKPYQLSYTTLKKMSKTPVINAIIKTRKNQIADFAEPQINKHSTGFIIQKKAREGVIQNMDKTDRKVANFITDFILNCGKVNSWGVDDFDTFIRKVIDDSLIFDQMTFEVVRNRKGQIDRFLATDASTFRMAESFFADDYKNPFFGRKGVSWADTTRQWGEPKDGYYPAYVQIYQNVIVNEFYPWELCFGTRNPSSSIYANGYGISELEELINVVTSLLWSDEYNRRFFSQGSAPKGLLRVKGNLNEGALQQFRQQWQSMLSGVMQSWKTPVVQADVDWVDLQKTNRDMEYSSWMEYLIKLSCSIYSIDPTEIGWDIARSHGQGAVFNSSHEERLKHSKDKGLYPLLKFTQRKLNRYVVEQINPDFELVFMGLNGMTIEQEMDMDIKKISNFQTLDEIREKWELKPIGEESGGNLILNSVFYQNLAAKRMQQQQQQMGGGMEDWGGEGEDEETNPFDLYIDDDEVEEDETEKSEHRQQFIKAFENFINNNKE